jgi:hypothetical protein
MRDDEGTGPPTTGCGRMGSKDPAGIPGLTSTTVEGYFSMAADA